MDGLVVVGQVGGCLVVVVCSVLFFCLFFPLTKQICKWH